MFYGNCLCGPGGNVVLCMNVAVFEDKSPAANPERCPSPSIADAGIEIDSPPPKPMNVYLGPRAFSCATLSGSRASERAEYL